MRLIDKLAKEYVQGSPPHSQPTEEMAYKDGFQKALELASSELNGCSEGCHVKVEELLGKEVPRAPVDQKKQ